MNSKHFWWLWWGFAVLWGYVVPHVLALDARLFSDGWWLNAAGHATFGIFIILHAQSLTVRTNVADTFAMRVLEYLLERPLLLCLCLTILWEIFEFSWDMFFYPLFPHLDMAQKGPVDTVLDVLVANVSAFATYCVWCNAQTPTPCTNEELP